MQKDPVFKEKFPEAAAAADTKTKASCMTVASYSVHRQSLRIELAKSGLNQQRL